VFDGTVAIWRSPLSFGKRRRSGVTTLKSACTHGPRF
jgi:hypothetical protein